MRPTPTPSPGARRYHPTLFSSCSFSCHLNPRLLSIARSLVAYFHHRDTNTTSSSPIVSTRSPRLTYSSVCARLARENVPSLRLRAATLRSRLGISLRRFWRLGLQRRRLVVHFESPPLLAPKPSNGNSFVVVVVLLLLLLVSSPKRRSPPFCR